LTAVGDTDNSVNCDATWSRVMMKKKECEAAVVKTLDATDSEPIAHTKNATKLKPVNKSIEEAKKDDEDIKSKKAASKKMAAEKRKATC